MNSLKNVKIISDKLNSYGKQSYIVGGFCREKIMGLNNDSGDIDLVSDAIPDFIKNKLNVKSEIGKKYGTCIVTEGGETFEITTFREDIGSINNRKPAVVKFTDSLLKDSSRRDFTFNAIYFDINTDKYIDPTGGIDDINNKTVRFIGNIEDRINEDALRILRCIRFKNRYNFKLASESDWGVLKNNVHLLDNLAVEKIKTEFDKILIGPNNIQALEDLKKIGFFKIFLPELDEMDQIPGNKNHLEGNVWIHTKMTIAELNRIVKVKNIDKNKALDLYRTMLLHDISKGDTLSIGDDGDAHYFGHEEEGAELFKSDISKRFKFSNSSKKKITWLIKNHIRLFIIPEMKVLKQRKLMMHYYFEDLLIVGEADNFGRLPVNSKTHYELIKIYDDFKKLIKGILFLTGKDIMDKYPELKGKEIGDKMNDLNTQILARA